MIYTPSNEQVVLLSTHIEVSGKLEDIIDIIKLYLYKNNAKYTLRNNNILFDVKIRNSFLIMVYHQNQHNKYIVEVQYIKRDYSVFISEHTYLFDELRNKLHL